MLKAFILLLILLPAFGLRSPGNDWNFEYNKNGIAVYTKPVPGYGANAVKLVCTLNSSMSGMVAMIVDISSYPKWIYRCQHAEILKTISPLEFIYHQETEAVSYTHLTLPTI